MFITYVEIKYGLLAMLLISAGLFSLVILVSGAHLLMREIVRSLKRNRARATSAHKPPEQHRQYVGAAD